MSESSSSAAALVPVDSEWQTIFHDSNQVVLYNPTSHALSIKPRPPCPYCKQPLPQGFEPPFVHSEPVHSYDHQSSSARASNYFQLLAIANESNSSPSTRASSRRPSAARIAESVLEDDDAEQASNRGRTTFPKGTLAEGYFNTFFKEECKLGMGANGSVFLCQHMLDGNALGHFAVKKIAVGESHAYLLNILREVRLLERLHHPNIITYHHAWLESSRFSSFGPIIPTLHVLMQWADGGSLEDYIDVRLGREPRHGQIFPNPYQSENIHPLDPTPTHLSSLSGSSSSPSLESNRQDSNMHSRSARIRAFRALQRASPAEKERIRKEMQFQESTSSNARQTTLTPVHLLSAEEVHSLFKDVVEGLAFLHDRSILHLDLKPGNVLLTWDDGRGKMIPRAMLSDFGTSRDMLVSSLNSRSGNTGTLEYSSPECLPAPQTGQLRQIDSKADMWSLGMVLHRMLFFKLPWKYAADGVGEDSDTAMGSTMPFEDARPKVRRPSAPNEAEKMQRLEEEVLSYPGFRSNSTLLKTLQGRKLPAAILLLLENLLNPIPSKRPTCEQVKIAVRDGKLDPLLNNYRNYSSSLTRNVYRESHSDKPSALVTTSIQTHSLVPISGHRARSHPPSSSIIPLQTPPQSSRSSSTDHAREESGKGNDIDFDGRRGDNDNVSRKNDMEMDSDSQEDVVYHDAREHDSGSEGFNQVRPVVEAEKPAGSSHVRKTLLALPAPVSKPLDMTARKMLWMKRYMPVWMDVNEMAVNKRATRTIKSVILVIKIFNLMTLCQCSHKLGTFSSSNGSGLATTVVVVFLAVVDTWFDGLRISILFGIAHVVVVKIGCFFMGDLCCCQSIL